MGGPNNTYQWLANGTNLDKQTHESLALFNLRASDGGMYSCVVSNAAGSHTASTHLFINPYFETPTGSIHTSIGSTVFLECEALSFPSPRYMWIHDQTALNENTRKLNLTNIQYGDEGAYFCNASLLMTTSFLVAAIYRRLTMHDHHDVRMMTPMQ
jgi:hypothetical protein